MIWLLPDGAIIVEVFIVPLRTHALINGTNLSSHDTGIDAFTSRVASAIGRELKPARERP